MSVICSINQNGLFKLLFSLGRWVIGYKASMQILNTYTYPLERNTHKVFPDEV